MIDSGPGITEGVAEETKPEVITYKEQIAKAEGTLIPLPKTTLDGKKLFITTRYIENPILQQGDQGPTIQENISPNVNSRFWGWAEDSMEKTGVILVDIYAKDGREILPLGHMDWWLDKDYANGGGNMHDAATPQNKHEQAARKRWDHRIEQAAFKVNPKYHNQGLGSLMLATSALVLEAKGIKRFYTGALLEPAQNTYARFNIQPLDFQGSGNDRSLPIERLSKHPQVNKTIAQFV